MTARGLITGRPGFAPAASEGASTRIPPWHLAVLFALVGLSAALCLYAGARPNDDAYITYRYAENLAHGRGFVYNPGERVLGTTTPLYTLLLAAAARLSASPVQASFVLGILSHLALLRLLYALFAGFGESGRGLAVVAAVGLLPQWIQYVVMGLETPFYVALVFGAILAAARRRAVIAGLLLGACCLTRPDGALAAAPVAYLLRPTGGRTLVACALAAAAVVIPWFLFAAWYFGSPVPNSVAAKAITFHVGVLGSAVGYFGRFIHEVTWKLPVDLVLLAAFFAGLPWALRKRESRGIGLWLLAYSAAFMFSGVMVFGWYSAAALPAYLWLLVAGLAAALQELARSAWWQRHRRLVLAAGLVATLPLSAKVASAYSTLGGSSTEPMSVVAAYRRAGEFVRAESRGTERTLAAAEIGAVGFYSDARILDLWALISPEALPYHRRMPRMQAFAALVRDLRPDWYVTPDAYLPAELAGSDWFGSQYSLRTSVPTRGGAVLVYRRSHAR
jgi:hypothetical protein